MVTSQVTRHKLPWPGWVSTALHAPVFVVRRLCWFCSSIFHLLYFEVGSDLCRKTLLSVEHGSKLGYLVPHVSDPAWYCWASVPRSFSERLSEVGVRGLNRGHLPQGGIVSNGGNDRGPWNSGALGQATQPSPSAARANTRSIRGSCSRPLILSFCVIGGHCLGLGAGGLRPCPLRLHLVTGLGWGVMPLRRCCVLLCDPRPFVYILCRGPLLRVPFTCSADVT